MAPKLARLKQESTKRVAPDMAVPSSQSLSGVRRGALDALRQGRELLSILDNEKYTSECAHAFNATIGQHYRHCLDHFDTFLTQVSEGVVNYDLRLRKADIEENIHVALELTKEFEMAIEEMKILDPDKKIFLNAGTGHEELTLCESTIARELYYVTAHATHHYALIAVIGCHFGIELPKNFGIAPSTVAYHDAKSNA